MGKMKELFLELQQAEHQECQRNQELYESYYLFQEAINFRTKALISGCKWKRVVLDLRNYNEVRPDLDPNCSVLRNNDELLTVKTPFNTINELWKMVQ